MGKKALLSCAACAASFKKKASTQTVESRAFCSVACAAAGPTAMASGYGDVPPAFGGGGAYASSRSGGSDRGASDGDTAGYDSRDSKRDGRKRKKSKKSRRGDSRATRESRPVESDPACVKILTELDDATSVLTSPGEALDRALRACVSSDVLAVDLEGVSMSRVGPVTLLQVAARDRVFLFDAQALGTAELFERAVRPESSEDGDAEDGDAGARTLRCVLEDPRITKLMFDCRVDSDALFHQHGVALRGVFDVQLADVASRRRKNLAVPLLSGMPKCAARHLAGASGATKQSLAALDADPDDRSVTRAGAASEAEAVTRVTEHLKTKVKALYAPDKGGDAQLWALRPISEDARRYAALDVWLLLRIHRAMTEDQALDEAWRARVVAASAHRETEYRALDEPVLQFRDPERAVAPDL